MNGVVTTFLTRDFPQTPRLLECDKAIHDITDEQRDSNPVDLKKGSFRNGSAAKARASRGVWGHAPEKILRYVP